MRPTKDYKVTWEIDIYADTPENAAIQARAIQLDPTGLATIFQVRERGKTNIHSDIIDTLEIG